MDEFDVEEPSIEALPGGAYRVNARMPLDEVNELLGADFPEGDWDTVVLDGYRAVVAASVERTVLDELPGRTAHEASVELARAFPTEGEALRSAADRFDAVRYGHDRATEADARAVLGLDDRVAGARPMLSPVGAPR